MQDALFTDHLSTLESRWESALDFAGYDACVITAGQARNYFLDDQPAVFRANPHFAQWLPTEDASASVLLVQPGVKPKLFFYQPSDYWHQPPQVPHWASAFDVEVHADEDSLLSALHQTLLGLTANRIALIGEGELANFPAAEINPVLLLNHLHFHRAYKTEFEVAAMRSASSKAIAGHLAAESAFKDGGSEFAINLAYLTASQHTAAELPYSSIVALNEHAGVLHYQHYDRQPPAEAHSFLIDAGARVHGYASDITRTYAKDENGIFASLVEQMDAAQRSLIETIRAGVNYLDLHISIHRSIGRMLAASSIVTCSAEAAFDSGITERFMPHGLGHLLGLQTHDVGGQLAGVEGGHNPPPARYAALRFTREVAEDMVFTIEPGLYFIPQLLDELRADKLAADINWPVLESLMPCGGIRIEDNVRVTRTGIENFTRDAFAAARND